MTRLESIWKNAFARAMSGAFTALPPELTQALTTQLGPAFTRGLAQTLLIMAGFLTVAAIAVFVGMPQGLQGSLIKPPQTSGDATTDPQATA
jgi:hypothetical protein